MSHSGMRHVTRIVSYYVTHFNESCHTVTLRTEACLVKESVMSHKGMSHVTQWNASRHTHCLVLCHAFQRVMSHISTIICRLVEMRDIIRDVCVCVCVCVYQLSFAGSMCKKRTRTHLFFAEKELFWRKHKALSQKYRVLFAEIPHRTRNDLDHTHTHTHTHTKSPIYFVKEIYPNKFLLSFRFPPQKLLPCDNTSSNSPGSRSHTHTHTHKEPYFL